MLKKDKDFKIVKEENGRGSIDEIFMLGDKKLKEITEPSINKIVYIYNCEKKWDDVNKVTNRINENLQLVMIKNGKFYGNRGGVSNFWTWYVLDENLNVVDEKSGYGYFFEPTENFEIKIKYDIKVTV